MRQVKAFQHVRATGEVTPSGWEPGQVTLKPGPALVGGSGRSGNPRRIGRRPFAVAGW